jgi:hypothetical protein
LKAYPRVTRAEVVCVLCYCAILLWVNLYICRDFFTDHTARMNSMHGFWAAMAKHAGSAWFAPTWWPYSYCGVPFEAVYAPLVPAFTAAWAIAGSIPYEQAFGAATGFFYCLAPLALFLMAWGLTRAPGTSFFASLLYSLTSVSQLLVPDGHFQLAQYWDSRRLFVTAVWDDTPHLAALSLLPLLILCLAYAIEQRGKIWYAAGAVVVALMTVASAFGPVDAVLASVCLLFVLRRENWRRNALVVAGIGALGYLLAIAFVPPSVWLAIQESARASNQEKWTIGSLTALTLLIAGWAVLWSLIHSRILQWPYQFFMLFTWVAFCIPFTGEILHRRLLPQPERYRLELELALTLPICFGAKYLLEKLPASVRRSFIFLLLAIAAEQVESHRKREKELLLPQDITQTVEYRAAIWAEHNLPSQRVFFPGSVAMWANDFTNIQQLSGGSWSMATNQSEQKAEIQIVFGSGASGRDASLTWLKAYGVSAVAVSARDSQEFWKPYADPSKFDSLPLLWTEGGVSIRRVPVLSASLAHFVPADAIVQHAPGNPEDLGEVARYVSALDDPGLPLPEMEWRGLNRILIHTNATAGHALSVQVSYHSGWHAAANGEPRKIRKDGLGLMWLDPACNGPCQIDLHYDGGWELRICRVISYATIAGLVFWLMFRAFTRSRNQA